MGKLSNKNSGCLEFVNRARLPYIGDKDVPIRLVDGNACFGKCGVRSPGPTAAVDGPKHFRAGGVENVDEAGFTGHVNGAVGAPDTDAISVGKGADGTMPAGPKRPNDSIGTLHSGGEVGDVGFNLR